ncbi:MAG: VWA domain-containing protein [Deltaproteobacteria bacterium]|nr:VWA domain-containing protein [Deltaproteobacteria bacterium]
MDRIIYDVPRWSLYLHRDARGLPSALTSDAPLRQLEDELFERLYAGEAESLAENKQHKQLGPWARDLHAACGAHPDFARLQKEVCGDSFMAGLAVEKILEQLKPDQPQNVRRQVGHGCSAAARAIDGAREALEGVAGVGCVGWGNSVGTNQPGKPRAVLQRLHADPRLRRVAAMAGRFKRIAAGRLRQKVKHAVGEVADIERGDALERLLPSDLARFVQPKLRLVFLRDLHERSAMQYAMRGQDHVGKGPLVVCLDKSGSMDGPRDEWASAVALALLDLAHRERRPFGLLTFDAGVRTKDLGQVGQSLPFDSLFQQCHGGTDLSGVVAAALDVIRFEQESLKKSDIVLITDGQSDASKSASLHDQAKVLNVAILGMSIGMPAEQLQPWCDEVVEIRDLDALPFEATDQLAGD